MIWTGEERRRGERRKGKRRRLSPLFFWTPDMAYRAIVVEERPVRDPFRPDRRSGQDRRGNGSRTEFIC